jgi:phosphoglycolate phosphatase-like HAD superfamily hydrolase
MSEFLEQDYQRVVHDNRETHFLPGTAIEIVRNPDRDRPPEHVLFDFDGTLSLIREGWPEVMVPLMVEVLQETGTDESADDLYRTAYNFVMELNGKQTIYQMIRLAEEVVKRGGHPKEPRHYKDVYHDRLMERIRSRREDLRSGRIPPEEMLVPGSFEMLETLQQKGVSLYVASGTDEPFVKEEAQLLGLDRYFGAHVYGAIDDYKSFSKAHVIQRILDVNRVDGARLLGFGDGYVEIQNVKAVGGTAVAVASDEAGRSGQPDAWKRNRLIGVGADVVIPDFRDYKTLVAYVWNV